MGKRGNDEIQKAIAEFLRKLEAGQKNKPKVEKRAKPAK